MKKLTALALTAALAAMLLAGCGGSSDTADAGTAGDGTAADNMTVEPADDAAAPEDTGDAAADAGDTADTGDAAGAEDVEPAHVGAIADAILAVNDVPNPRDYDDFAVEYDLGLNPDDVVQFAGCVTNDAPADCALVFVAQVKEGTTDAAVAALEAARENMSGSLYAEFADATAKAAEGRIVSSGDVVVFVIAGVNGPDYSAIDEAISTALGQ